MSLNHKDYSGFLPGYFTRYSSIGVTDGLIQVPLAYLTQCYWGAQSADITCDLSYTTSFLGPAPPTGSGYTWIGTITGTQTLGPSQNSFLGLPPGARTPKNLATTPGPLINYPNAFTDAGDFYGEPEEPGPTNYSYSNASSIGVNWFWYFSDFNPQTLLVAYDPTSGNYYTRLNCQGGLGFSGNSFGTLKDSAFPPNSDSGARLHLQVNGSDIGAPLPLYIRSPLPIAGPNSLSGTITVNINNFWTP